MDIIREYIISQQAASGHNPVTANPVGGQVEAGETTGYMHRLKADRTQRGNRAA